MRKKLLYTSFHGVRYYGTTFPPHVREECERTELRFLRQWGSDKYRAKAKRKLKRAKVTLVDAIHFPCSFWTGYCRGTKSGNRIKAVIWNNARSEYQSDVPRDAKHLQTGESIGKGKGKKAREHWRQWAAVWAVPWLGVNEVLLHEFNHFWGRNVGHTKSVHDVLGKRFGGK